jgi:hypothetical protein
VKIWNRHERTVAAVPERVVGLISDFDGVWPTAISPPPRLRGNGMYEVGVMLWQELDRPGAARAFRVVEPAELEAEHWFDVTPAAGMSIVRHTIEGHARGKYAAIWSEKIEPLHNLILEALLDNVEASSR